jgi:hypothetical protein
LPGDRNLAATALAPSASLISLSQKAENLSPSTTFARPVFYGGCGRPRPGISIEFIAGEIDKS